MAIDFMTMPLSRYLSGDFVTPTMRFAWQQGLPYTLIGPEGRRDIPKDTPFGGPGAAARRATFVPMVVDDLKKLPGSLAGSWDEASSATPTFHRVEPKSYEQLLAEAVPHARPTFLGFPKRKPSGRAHIAASVFFPLAFDEPFAMPVVFERLAGSAPIALRELEAGGWSNTTANARDALLDALRDAIHLRLPMIVDM